VWYRITGAERLRPFLVSLASDSDLWMFITSNGGLTAGRIDPEGALFPYLTVDRLHEAHHHTGPVTLFRVQAQGKEPLLWEPFAPEGGRDPAISRYLEKNTTGNRMVFGEIHSGLGLAFRYEWSPSAKFGWVRTATLSNDGNDTLRVDVLDGLRNILPWGVPLSMYQQASNLVDAYRRCEVDTDTGLGIFSLTAGITDRAEAVEVLRANSVWCTGRDDFRVHLDPVCLRQFRGGEVMAADRISNGGRGNYLISFACETSPGDPVSWRLVCDGGLDHGRLTSLRRMMEDGHQLDAGVAADVQRSQDSLRRQVAAADGLQLTARTEAWTHHFANTLFNIMRGGVFADNYTLPRDDFLAFLETRNPDVAARNAVLLADLPEELEISRLRATADRSGDADLVRLSLEYLPLQFGRRHGDPSRPWNRFTIRVRDDEDRPLLNYEGNWRDIFQNWEALATAYPGFLPNMVAKFLNASTVDGFNPYRINREGVEWEVAGKDDPWANIGYWGDHQIVYLTRLLEAWDRHDSGGMSGMLAEEIFSYAEVPYRLKTPSEILADPSRSIVFDRDLDNRIASRVAASGTDGKLLHGADGEVVHVSMLEKLLVPVLSKLSNLVPDGGIWMNTQRPEWNDANNALAGWGLSVVTLAHLRRHLSLLAELLEREPQRDCPLSVEVHAWLEKLEKAYAEIPAQRAGTDRRRFLDTVSEAFADYLQAVYSDGISGHRALDAGRVAAFFRLVLAEVDRSLAANRRPGGLYHAYNLMQPNSDDGLEIGRLQIMLEGQVAVLGSGILGAEESVSLLRTLFASELYCRDRGSFLLYPERELPGFLQRNRIPDGATEEIPLLRELLAVETGTLVRRDAEGICRFHSDLVRAADLEAALNTLAEDSAWTKTVDRDREAVQGLYEAVFHHLSFTGRSGTMYGYEGLGCIYWHMVGKLLLAVQETFERGRDAGWDGAMLNELAGLYFRIRGGLGYRKSVAEFGAFPSDPYSHTPGDGGARQPGMTGQVKEEILTRLGELGVRIDGGEVRFAPALLEKSEFLDEPREFIYRDTSGRCQALSLQAGELAFTLCQTPVVYRLGEGSAGLIVTFADGGTKVRQGNRLGTSLSRELFSRSGRLAVLRVEVAADSLDGWTPLAVE